MARDGKESILSLSVKAFGTPKIIAKVPASAFRPAPKVDSAIIAVEQIKIDTGAGERFFQIVKAGFAHKRKLLARNLEEVSEKNTITKIFAENDISPNARAEDIKLDIWLKIAKEL